MTFAKKLLAPSLLLTLAIPLVAAGGVFAYSAEDEPPFTDRVARISFIKGSVQVRRAGSQDWEAATLNLPLVEGDEIATGEWGSRVEIQFTVRTHARLDERSLLRITTLKDEGIALSISQGDLVVRAGEFDKDRSYFEIDAPRTTIALQRAGMYRVSAGRQNAVDIRISATDGGEARVYTSESGFTLRSGRSARIPIDGPNAGEWEVADASLFTDQFDNWSLDRDAVIAKRVRDAYYDKYYDRDIYGADELSDYGEWIYTRKYGYVWRPYAAATRTYADWSPYRYGHWRWVPPFGWTWVNDEPWGWATYHHGRWVWDGGYWVWTPYGYYRSRRSWWSPALVVVTVVNRRVCWYPLPYDYAYYNYNHYYNGGGRRGGGHRNPPGGGPAVTPSPTPGGGVITENDNEARRRRMQTPPLQQVPPGGVVIADETEFGKGTRTIRRAPLEVAKAVLSKEPADVEQTPPILPPIEEVRSRGAKAEYAATPPIWVSNDRLDTKVGAAERKPAQPLDETLRRERIFGNRPPVVTTEQTPREPGTGGKSDDDDRPTGAVQRPTRRLPPTSETPPIYQPPAGKSGDGGSNEERKVERQPTFNPRPRRELPPSYDPPKSDRPYQPPKQDEPNYEPPPQRDPPRRQPPTYEPPPQKSEPPGKSDPPPPPPPPQQKPEERPSQPLPQQQPRKTEKDDGRQRR